MVVDFQGIRKTCKTKHRSQCKLVTFCATKRASLPLKMGPCLSKMYILPNFPKDPIQVCPTGFRTLHFYDLKNGIHKPSNPTNFWGSGSGFLGIWKSPWDLVGGWTSRNRGENLKKCLKPPPGVYEMFLSLTSLFLHVAFLEMLFQWSGTSPPANPWWFVLHEPSKLRFIKFPLNLKYHENGGLNTTTVSKLKLPSSWLLEMILRFSFKKVKEVGLLEETFLTTKHQSQNRGNISTHPFYGPAGQRNRSASCFETTLYGDRWKTLEEWATWRWS